MLLNSHSYCSRRFFAYSSLVQYSVFISEALPPPQLAAMRAEASATARYRDGRFDEVTKVCVWARVWAVCVCVCVP